MTGHVQGLRDNPTSEELVRGSEDQIGETTMFWKVGNSGARLRGGAVDESRVHRRTHAR